MARQAVEALYAAEIQAQRSDRRRSLRTTFSSKLSPCEQLGLRRVQGLMDDRLAMSRELFELRRRVAARAQRERLMPADALEAELDEMEHRHGLCFFDVVHTHRLEWWAVMNELDADPGAYGDVPVRTLLRHWRQLFGALERVAISVPA